MDSMKKFLKHLRALREAIDELGNPMYMWYAHSDAKPQDLVEVAQACAEVASGLAICAQTFIENWDFTTDKPSDATPGARAAEQDHAQLQA